ncbi:hypothetical protein WJX74_008095 [Apatococcus lobatus]|uniref:Glycosyltransferase 61 catalytic domain-containing protein n=1 Tax=Apatococcus lobatus TaxID=904363 RepID=A0AAW1RWB1_9CHLO
MLPSVVHKKPRRGNFPRPSSLYFGIFCLLFLVAIGNLTWKCVGPPDDGDPDHQICKLFNVVVAGDEIYYISDEPEQLPKIDITWLHIYDQMKYLRIKVRRPSELPFDIMSTEVERVKYGVFWFFGSADNYSHDITEYGPAIHSLLCRLLNICMYDKASPLRIFRINQDQLPTDQGIFPPAFREAMQCFSSHPVHKLGDAAHKDKVVLVETGLAGVGEDCRAFHWCSPQWNRKPMQHDMMRSYQQRLADCTGWDIDAVAPYDPPIITIIDRRLTSQRHILNIDNVLAHFKQRFAGAHVTVLYAEDMGLLGQIQAASTSSVFIVMHGAALANFIFLPQGAAGVHMVGDPQYPALHNWAEDMVRDMPQHVQLVEYTNRQSAGIHLVGELVQQDPEFQRLSPEQQQQLLEHGICPKEPEDIFQHCRAVWLVKMANFDINAHELGGVVQAGLNFVKEQHAKRAQLEQHISSASLHDV